MKGMPLPFDFEGKGVLDLDLIVNSKRSFADYAWKICCSIGEPDSVLDSAKIPSRPTSSSTLSSSLGGGGGGGGGSTGGAASTDTAGVAAAEAVSDANRSPGWQQESATATSSIAGGADSELLPIPPSLEIGGSTDKFAMEDWESVLSESVAVSPTQEQSILRWIMGDVDDPAMGSLNKVLQIGASGGSAAPEFDFGAGFDQLGFDGDQFGGGFPNQSFNNCNRSAAENIAAVPSPAVSLNLNPNFKFFPNSRNTIHPANLAAISHHQPSFDFSSDIKPPAYSSQNPSFVFPQQQQEQNLLVPPQAKRHNPGNHQIWKGPFPDTGQQEMFMGRQQLDSQQLHLLPHYLQQRSIGQGKSPKISGSDELGHGHQQQAIVDQLYNAAELIQTGNPVLAQAILARLNHQLSPIGKPFNRAAFYCKEALQLLLHPNCNTNWSPISLVFKIGAYKAFSEISPLIQFANFTCNQALLEVFQGFDHIHIVDFDIGYGGQWASLMQELALRSGGAPSMKITALTSPSTHDQIELGLTRENLIQFANEINIAFQFEITSIESFNSGSWSLPLENEAIAVNLPVGSLANHHLSAPMILSFVKQLSPRIIVSVDRGCDRTDLPFANHIIHALQSYSNLLESLDSGNSNADALQKIERLLLQPAIEKIVLCRFRAPEKTQHWRAMFLSSGFSPLAFSNFTESQAECVVKRTPIRGFEVEKRQSSLVLCWHRKELISASAWGC